MNLFAPLKAQNVAPVATDILLAVPSNDDCVLSANLLDSPPVASGHLPVHIERNAKSAAQAFNRVLDKTTAPYIVFVHHDVWLPTGWDALLRSRISEVAAKDPNWALIGAFGVGLDGGGIGPVWSSSIGHVVGRVPLKPEPVQSMDELLIVLRRDSGLRFDDDLPGFHLFGTDIVQSARSKGLGAYAAALPVIHNDCYKEQLDDKFGAAYHHLQTKWRADLPLVTPITKISGHGLHLHLSRWRNMRTKKVRSDMAVETAIAPEMWAARCGWADLTPSGSAE